MDNKTREAFIKFLTNEMERNIELEATCLKAVNGRKELMVKDAVSEAFAYTARSIKRLISYMSEGDLFDKFYLNENN